MPQATKTFNTYLEHQDGSANKHKWYRVIVESTVLQTHEEHKIYYSHGRIGSKGISKLKDTRSNFNSALNLADELVDNKVNGRDRYTIKNELNSNKNLQVIKDLQKEVQEKASSVKKNAQIKKMMDNVSNDEQHAIVLSARSGVFSIGYLKGRFLADLPNSVINPFNIAVETFDAITIVKDTNGKIMIKNTLGHYGDFKGPLNKPVFAVSA